MRKLFRKIWHDLYYARENERALEFALRCKEVTSLIDLPESQMKGLTKLRLRLHLSLCQACADYYDMSRALRRAANEFVEQSAKFTELEGLNRRLLERHRNRS